MLRQTQGRAIWKWTMPRMVTRRPRNPSQTAQLQRRPLSVCASHQMQHRGTHCSRSVTALTVAGWTETSSLSPTCLGRCQPSPRCQKTPLRP